MKRLFKGGLDEALRTLQSVAALSGVGSIDVDVRQDGRVEFRIGAKVLRADLLPGSALALPSDVLQDEMDRIDGNG